MQSGLRVKLETPPDVPARFRVLRDSNLVAIDYGAQLPSLCLRRAYCRKKPFRWVSVLLEKILLISCRRA